MGRRPATTARVEVAFAQPYRLRPAGTVRLACLDGTAWITLDGQLADVVLPAGASVCVAAREDVLVVGLPRCTLHIEPVAAGACDRLVSALS